MHIRQTQRDPITTDDLKELDEVLTSVVGAILQKPNRVAGTIVGVAASKLVAAGIVAGTFGAIGAFGVASTGTAIAALSGAAATTATLYWIGASVGLGVAAGGFMLTGGALAVGVPAAIYTRRKLFGRPRTEEKLNDHEQALLYAALRLATALRITSLKDTKPTITEMRLVSDLGIQPLASNLATTFLDTKSETKDCVSHQSSLALLPRQRLRKAFVKLDLLSQKWSNQ